MAENEEAEGKEAAPDITKHDELVAYIVDCFPPEAQGLILKHEFRSGFEGALKVLDGWGWFKKGQRVWSPVEQPQGLKVGQKIKVRVRHRIEGSKKMDSRILEGTFIRWVPTGYAFVVDDNQVTHRGVPVEVEV